MDEDWALARSGSGVLVRHAEDGSVVALEFNAFLRAIAAGTVREEDLVLSRVYTDGRIRRVGGLRMFLKVQSGEVQTGDLPIRTPGGVLLDGARAARIWRRLAGDRRRSQEAGELLRPAIDPVGQVEDELLLRPAVPDGAVAGDNLLRPAATEAPESGTGGSGTPSPRDLA
jgi:hypothetical protein